MIEIRRGKTHSGRHQWRATAGGAAQAVATKAHESIWPAIALRGNRLAFTERYGDSNIWQYERTAPGQGFGAPKCLICSTVEDDTPRFSPDGRKIVFVSKRTGSQELWVADSDGRYPMQLTSFGGAPTGSPRWSPDGRWIAFDSRIRGNADVFVISAQGGTPRALTTEQTKETVPGWSQDGHWIYFCSDRGNLNRLWKAPFEGGAARQITQGPGCESMESSDGKLLYYFNGNSVWTVPVDGGPETIVPELRDIGGTRAWMLRDQGIYFYQDGPGDQHVIRFFDFATRKVTTALEPTVGPLRGTPGIDVSPDGRRLLYTQTDQRVEGLFMIENFR